MDDKKGGKYRCELLTYDRYCHIRPVQWRIRNSEEECMLLEEKGGQYRREPLTYDRYRHIRPVFQNNGELVVD